MDGLECHLIQPFRFQDTVHTLRNGILIRISIFGHTDLDAVFLQFGDILQAAVLTPPIRVVYQSSQSSCRIFGESHVQRPERPCRIQGVVQGISHDLMREGICDERQVEEVLRRPPHNFDIRDIADPYFIRPRGFHFTYQVGPLLHPVPRVGRHCPAAVTLHQHSAVAKKVEQSVSADIVTVFLQEYQQFSDPEPGQVLADKPHLVDNGRIVYFFNTGGVTLLPVSLAGEAEQSTKSVKAYFRMSLFEFFDCSASTFFDRSMPYSSLRILIITSKPSALILESFNASSSALILSWRSCTSS